LDKTLEVEEIEANSQMKFKIRFQPTNMRNSICNGLIKIRVIARVQKELYSNVYYVQMIGFIGKSYIFVDNLMKQTQSDNLLSTINYSLKHLIDESTLKYI
jgi:hypothetical protein